MLSSTRWLKHVEEDLDPWWLDKNAFGEPIGNFPSFRCDNGELVNLSELCPAFKNLPSDYDWLPLVLDKNFIVSQSRQVYTYGVAYHLTGDPKFLSLAKAGVDWIRQYGLDQENGGSFKYLQIADRKPDLSVGQRTSQDLAYTLQGMSFYYYLTRDEEILSDIISLKNFIFDNYYDSEQGLMMWTPGKYEGQNSSDEYYYQRKRLISQLDQINGYMLLLIPMLPEPYKSQWKEDLVNLSEVLIDKFYSPKYNVFWLDLDKTEDRKLLPDKADYGHTIKSLWMIYHTGQLVDDESLINFATTNADRLLQEAYDSDSGTWASAPFLDENGKIVRDLDKNWWIYAELDQVAGTLSLIEPSYVDKYLQSTVNWWFDNMVDPTNYEVWSLLTLPKLEKKLPKQYHWKNGYHSYEHALVGYITSGATQGDLVELYFARKHGQEKESIRPYYYTGQIAELEIEPMPLVADNNLSSIPELNKVTVTFKQIK